MSVLTYDPATGNLLSVVADSANFKPRTSFTYNAMGVPTSTTDPLGVVTRQTYDGFGNRTSTVADAGPGRLNQTTTIAYSARGDPVLVIDPKGNVATSTYDAARRMLTTTTPGTVEALGGLVTTNTYDADNRVTQVQQSTGGSILRTSSSTWTRTGKVATATDPKGGITRYAYDPLDRLSTVTDAMGRTTRFTYDAVSRSTETPEPRHTVGAAPQADLDRQRQGRLPGRRQRQHHRLRLRRLRPAGHHDVPPRQHRGLHLGYRRQRPHPQDAGERDLHLRLRHAQPPHDQNSSDRPGGDLQL